jgi:hypothetical protein
MSQSKHRSLNAIEQHYDFIIVGAGSSGSVVAGELARRSDASVLLVEAGPAADNNPDTLSADGFKYCFANDNVMHDRFSEKITGLNGRSVYQGTGWTMGGSGSVNGMVYTPGDKQDFTIQDAYYQSWILNENEKGTIIIVEVKNIKPNIEFLSIVFRGIEIPLSSVRKNDTLVLKANLLTGLSKLEQKNEINSKEDQLIYQIRSINKTVLLKKIRRQKTIYY